jgi:CRISPR/Cas system-associated endoribonuclease Cas2
MKPEEKKPTIYVVTYDINTHLTDKENRQKFYDFIDDQDFCPITESACLLCTSMSAKELSQALARFILSERDALFIAGISGECEVYLPTDEKDHVNKWLMAHLVA